MYRKLREISNIHNKYSISTANREKPLKKRFILTLQRLIKDPEKVILMAKNFRIFPSFFRDDILEKMLKSTEMNQYLQYVQTRKQEKPNPEVSEILQKLNLQKHTDQRIVECYINYLRRNQDLIESDNLMEIFDLRNPQNWFGIIKDQRRFIYHHGPTNSGKTYSAVNQLRGLREDQKGVYMAPLRLLAWQTQQKLGKCNLITGQEKDYQNSNLTSCTIQACRLDIEYEVAIIDEIQMIQDHERGWGWTNKILGLRAKKIHLCGDERALDLISRIIQKSGGTLQEKVYNRLSKLHLITKNFEMKDLQPGDCMIDFSASKLYFHRAKINNMIKQNSNEQKIENKTAIIYGKMPPICRKNQAQLFNKGQLPYLVASNAIGMGLNLMIRRIIFTNLLRMSSTGYQKILENHQIRQIAGRAGRGMDHGYVFCSNVTIRKKVKNALKKVNITIDQKVQQDPNKQQDQIVNHELSNQQNQQIFPNQQNQQSLSNQQNLQYNELLKRYLTADQRKISKAGLFFPYTIIQRIKYKIQNLMGRKMKLSDVIKLICNLSQQSKQLYFIQNIKRLVKLSDKLQKLNLPLYYQYLFASMPVNDNQQSLFLQLIYKYAEQFNKYGNVTIPADILNNYEKQFEEFKSIKDIQKLQRYYVHLDGYTWLWNHFQLYFPQGVLAERIKEAVCLKINDLLLINEDIKNKNKDKKNKKDRRDKDRKFCQTEEVIGVNQ